MAGSKGNALPMVRTPEQKKQAARVAKKAAADALAKNNAVRLAQIVNLHIAGMSLAEIGVATGSSEAEIDRLLSQETARYIRSQPALRNYVRNFANAKYTKLLETVWARATDPTHKENFEAIDRAERLVTRMAKLNGAEMPVQSEVKIDAAPEAVEKLVHALASASGLGYDANVFDVVDAVLVESTEFLETSTEAETGSEVETL